MALQILDEADVRRIARDEAKRPVFTHQRRVEGDLGIPPKEYLTAAHAGMFLWTKERRLIIARTADVIAWLERRITHRNVKPANDADGETIALGRVGARRVAG
ncbi:MAG: hypothetical protein U0270_41210 [Labilithrix sp.]